MFPAFRTPPMTSPPREIWDGITAIWQAVAADPEDRFCQIGTLVRIVFFESIVLNSFFCIESCPTAELAHRMLTIYTRSDRAGEARAAGDGLRSDGEWRRD